MNIACQQENPSMSFPRKRESFKLLLVLSLITMITMAYGDPAITLTYTPFSQLPGWQSGQQGSSLQAFQHSCEAILKKKHFQPFGTGDWHRVCNKALTLKKADDKTARQFFTDNFEAMQVHYRHKKQGLFTGYYTPLLQGSLKQYGPYQVPIYGRPKALTTKRNKKTGQLQYGVYHHGRFQPYYSRTDINDGALAGKGLEILWLKSRIDRFFLQVQGSGIVQLDNGQLIQLVFAGKNGQPYTALGKILIDIDVMAPGQVTMQGIKHWLAKRPGLGQEIMDQNASFIFFKTKPINGPLHGAQGVPLTPGRSMAVDRHFIPLGMPIWLDTSIPTGVNTPKDYRQLMVSQDVGSAIKGPIRGDIYWGTTAKAEFIAGHMQNPGQYWVLIPKA